MKPLEVWLWSRLAVFVAAAAGVWVVERRPAGELPGFVERWASWDADLYRKIAEFGYDGYPEHYPDEGVVALFPGFPLLLRLVHVVVPDWTLAGLLISLLAGAVAAVALGRLARMDGVPDDRAVLYLVLAPTAVFLAAGYTEALFLALALPSWLAARRGDWRAAGVLAGAAVFVRVTGLFLAAALVVEYLVRSRGRLRWDVLWLLVPGLVVLAYFGYVWHLTGDWLGWFHAQGAGWNRSLTPPWEAFEATLVGARSETLPADFVLSYRFEILAVLAGVVLTAVLLWLRRWGEATYVGLSVLALATSSFYLSVARNALLWFPLWLLLAGARSPAVHRAYVAVSAPLMVVGVVAFTTGVWWG